MKTTGDRVFDGVTWALLVCAVLVFTWQLGRMYGQHEADPAPLEVRVTLAPLHDEDEVVCMPVGDWDALREEVSGD